MTDKINYTHRHKRVLTRLQLHVCAHRHRCRRRHRYRHWRSRTHTGAAIALEHFVLRRSSRLISPRVVFAFRFVWLSKSKSFLPGNLRPCLAGNCV